VIAAGKTRQRMGNPLDWNDLNTTGHSPNMRYSGPQLLSSWLHGAAPRQPSCHPPRRARVVGPAELTVRRRTDIYC
jgi:hypothetical protein